MNFKFFNNSSKETFSKNSKNKYFCIGLNKTGTTSIQKLFLDLGYRVGDQKEAEMIFKNDFFNKNYSNLINYCLKFEVFQDLPFSLFDVVPILDKAFPQSRFILTIRDNPEQWYSSITRFHSNLFGQRGKIPNKTDLLNSNFLGEGFLYIMIKRIFNTPDDDLYNKDILINYYVNHIVNVLKYFRTRQGDLLILNLNKSRIQDFFHFINVPNPGFLSFPWENKTL